MTFRKQSRSPLAAIEPRLRTLLPADLYAAMWMTPDVATLTNVFDHLRTLHRALMNYLPREVIERLPTPGDVRFTWQEGALMFTDLAGFTPLVEAGQASGRVGAETLLALLNRYFAEMIAIISKSGGNLLEFTGDAMLTQFPANRRRNETAQAIRAGLRMQRAMAQFARVETAQGVFTFGMRIGIHSGRFLSAAIGTPRRMEQVLLGSAVRQAKHVETAGHVRRVCVSSAAHAQVDGQFSYEPLGSDFGLVIDDLTDDQLGEYEIAPSSRTAGPVLLDRSIGGIVRSIEHAVDLIEPLASYVPMPILNLVVEHAARRRIAPEFPDLTVMFVKLAGLAESVDLAATDEIPGLLASFSHLFALITAAVEARGGVLKNITHQNTGSDLLIFFGAPMAHPDDARRAAATALAVHEIVRNHTPPRIDGIPARIDCRIGMAYGPAFVAEIGEPNGRREYNLLGDVVNTAARLVSHARTGQILVTDPLNQLIGTNHNTRLLGPVALKGKEMSQLVFELLRPR
ncbi:MAG TPA: adenylate/guanylate cyclase domain-containing protein [Roseiflexaceae bacterium]|nr:adenylate/guanylate cyclase domain-containing protein [Roseiflexaceae bacterium]HMP39372.1 adenylate/guanylate cyclase domain-containing protein [Roseiflexaceae bacterium]